MYVQPHSYNNNWRYWKFLQKWAEQQFLPNPDKATTIIDPRIKLRKIQKLDTKTKSLLKTKRATNGILSHQIFQVYT